MSCPAISFCALFSPFVTWNARSWTIRNHTLSRNIAFPIRGMSCCAWRWAPPHGAASTTGWQKHPWGPGEVWVSWTPHCGVQPSRYTGYHTILQSCCIKTTVNVKCKGLHCSELPVPSLNSVLFWIISHCCKILQDSKLGSGHTSHEMQQ